MKPFRHNRSWHLRWLTLYTLNMQIFSSQIYNLKENSRKFNLCTQVERYRIGEKDLNSAITLVNVELYDLHKQIRIIRCLLMTIHLYLEIIKFWTFSQTFVFSEINNDHSAIGLQDYIPRHAVSLSLF